MKKVFLYNFVFCKPIPVAMNNCSPFDAKNEIKIKRWNNGYMWTDRCSRFLCAYVIYNYAENQYYLNLKYISVLFLDGKIVGGHGYIE